MTSASLDPAISEQEWERSIDDPFSADAIGLLQHLTPRTAQQQQQQQQPDERKEELLAAASALDAHDSLLIAPDSSVSTAARHVSPLSPRSTVSPVGRRSSAITPTSQPRASIYDDQDDDRQSQEDSSTARRHPPPARSHTAQHSSRSITAPLLAAAPPVVPAHLARTDNWLQHGKGKGKEKEEKAETKEERGPELDEQNESELEVARAAASDGMLGGFTTGSSKPVAVSAASMERARRLMAEADEAYSQQYQGADEARPTLHSAQRSKQSQPQPQPQRRSFASPAALSASPSLLLLPQKKAATSAPLSSFKTPARPARLTSSPADSAPLASHQRPAPQQRDQQQQHVRSANGGVPAGVDLMAGFATGSGRKVSVSEASLKRAHQLILDAEVDESDRQHRTTSDAGGATELSFTSLRSYQEQRQQQQQRAAASSTSFSAPSSLAQPFRPPPSTFRRPARVTPRHAPPLAPSTSAATMILRSDTHTESREEDNERQMQHDTAESTPTQKLSKRAEFDRWFNAQSMQLDEQDSDGMMLLPPHIDADDGTAAMELNTSTAAEVTLATFDDEPDSAVLSSLPSTESSAFTSSPASTSTASSYPSPQLLPDSLHAAPFGGFGGFVTGSNVRVSVRPDSLLRAQQLLADTEREQRDEQQQPAHEEHSGEEAMSLGFVTGTGKKAANVRPESLRRAQQLIADAQQHDEQQEEGDRPILAGFVTGGGKKAAALRPESVLRAQQLLADADVMEQRDDRQDKEEKTARTAEDKPLLGSRKGRPPLAALPLNTLHARDEHDSGRPTTASHSGGRELLSASKADKEAHVDRPLLARRQVGKRLNERTAIDLQCSPLTDSPLSSPVTALLHVQTEKAALVNRDAKATNKKRKLTFNTPRTVAPGVRQSGNKSKQADTDQQPNLLSVKHEHRSATAQQAPARTAKGMSATLPTPPPLPRMLSAPLPLSPFDVLPVSLKAQRMERLSRDELIGMGVSAAVVDMTSYTALTHTFPCPSESALCYSASTAYFHLLESGCDRSLLSVLWVRNHYRWIVWKLACTERSYPTLLSGRCCTYYQVMVQLRRRVDRELERVQRPTLAKLLEQDESAARYMVLCVAAILPATAAGEEADDDDPDTTLLVHRKQYGVCHLELTDGWYSVAAKLDGPLLEQLHRDRIRVGDKLRVLNASLAGASEACTPLENENVYLELHHNSTRRAGDDCKLGMQRTATFSVCLASVREGGGAIPCMHAAVGRVYPIMCMEVMEDGTKVHRNQRAEDAQQERWERRMEKEMEQKRAQWEQKMEQHTVVHSHSQQLYGATLVTQSQPSQLLHSEPLHLTSSVLSAEALELELEAPEPRRLVPYLKVRLYEIVPPTATIALAEDESTKKDDGSTSSAAVLTGAECAFTVWRPTEEDMHALTEGNVVSIYSAQVAGRHDGMLRLSSSRATPIVTNAGIAPLTALFRRLCGFPQLHALQRSDEFDCAVCVVYEQRYSSLAMFSGEQQLTRQLYCCYDTDELLMIDVKEDDTQLHFAANQPISAPITVLACNLRYTGYDSTHRVHTAQSSASASFFSRTAAGPERHETDKGGAHRRSLMDGWRQCRHWFTTEGGRQVAAMQRQRAVALVEGLEDRQQVEQLPEVGSQRWYDALLRAIAKAQTDVTKSSAGGVK